MMYSIYRGIHYLRTKKWLSHNLIVKLFGLFVKGRIVRFYKGFRGFTPEPNRKTGTAQKYENGRIASGKYVSSFVGFFPAESPKYLALITVDEPQGAYYGSVVAAPCAKDVFEGIISLKNIQADI